MRFLHFGFNKQLVFAYVFFSSLWGLFSEQIFKHIFPQTTNSIVFFSFQYGVFTFISLLLLLAWHKHSFDRQQKEWKQKEAQRMACLNFYTQTE